MINALPSETRDPAGDTAPQAADAMMARDRAIEAWLRGEVVAAYDALRSEPQLGISIATLRARLAAQGMMSR